MDKNEIIAQLKLAIESAITDEQIFTRNTPFNSNELTAIISKITLLTININKLQNDFTKNLAKNERIKKMTLLVEEIIDYLKKFRLEISEISGGVDEENKLRNPLELRNVTQFLNQENNPYNKYKLKYHLDYFINQVNTFEEFALPLILLKMSLIPL
jgi:hypothetical protein